MGLEGFGWWVDFGLISPREQRQICVVAILGWVAILDESKHLEIFGREKGAALNQISTHFHHINISSA
jgi:hypothetical protein